MCVVVFDGPIESEPSGFVPRAGQLDVLLECLAGIELGAWDLRIVSWLSGWDWPTVSTIVSWLWRVSAGSAPQPSL